MPTVQGLVRRLTIQRRLKTSFDGQHVKPFRTLLKSSWERFCHIFSSLWGKIIIKKKNIKQPYDFKLQSGRCHEDFTSVWNGLTCSLSKDVFRRRWIVSSVTKPWTVANFGKTLTIKIFFFWKMFKIRWRFHKGNKKLSKWFLFLR